MAYLHILYGPAAVQALKLTSEYSPLKALRKHSLEDTSWQKAQVNELHDFTCSHQSCVICSLGSMKCILKGEKAQHVCVHGPHNVEDCDQDAGACVVVYGTNPCRMRPLQCKDL